MSEPTKEARSRGGRRGQVEAPYRDYHREVMDWLDAWERTPAELADQLRVRSRDLSAALRGQLYSPWILDRVRSITDIAPPADERGLSARAETTRRYRLLLELLPGVEDKIRYKKGGDPSRSREALIGDLRELSGRAVDFAQWLERGLGGRHTGTRPWAGGLSEAVPASNGSGDG